MTKRKGRRKGHRRRGVYGGLAYGLAAYGYPLGAITGVQSPVLGPQFPTEGGSGDAGGSGEGGTPA